MASPKKWWHFETPRKFYYCQILGGGPPTKKHMFRWRARQEAVRLSLVHGLPVYVLATVDVVMPAQPAPAPEVLIHNYEGGRDLYFNYFEEVTSKTA